MSHAIKLIAASALTLLALAAPAQAAAPGWEAIGVTAPTHLPSKTSEVQRVAVDATGGTYTLSFAAQATGPIAFDASSAEIESALEALSTIGGAGGSVEVEGGPGNAGAGSPYHVRFGGALAGTDVAQLTSGPGGLSGGAAAATVSTDVAGGAAGTGAISIYGLNVGGAATAGAYTISVDLPAGITTSAAPGNLNFPWSCTPGGAGQSSFSCTNSTAVPVGASTPVLAVPVVVSTPSAEAELSASVEIAGGGAATGASYELPIVVSDTAAEAGVQEFWAGAFDENGLPENRAGAHPFTASTMFFLNTQLSTAGKVVPIGYVRDIKVDPPVGLIGNPLVTERCPRMDPICDDPDALIGRVNLLTRFVPSDIVSNPMSADDVYNVRPPHGAAAQFTFAVVFARATVLARLRAGDYGVSAIASNTPYDYKVYGARVTLWGKPAGATGAFLTNPTECTGNTLETLIEADTWQMQGVFAGDSDFTPAMTDCGDVPFDPSVDVATTSAAADATSGLDFDVEVPQEGLLDPDGIATSHLRDVEVDLPEGVAVNPSGATGLEGCSDAQMAQGSNSVPACPDGSKIGTVEATSPLADHAVGGTMYLGSPKSTDPTSGEMFRLWVVARDDELGVMIKLPGSATADPQTGKLHATFENNPRLPFDHLSVKLKGGDRGLLAMPQTCGSRSIGAELSPWSGTSPVSSSLPIDTTEGCAFGFAPTVAAGSANTGARSSGDFSFELTRPQGDRWVDGIAAHLPDGLLASLKGVPLCSNVQANAGACPESSRIGTVDASAGSGDPVGVEQKGAAYLTEGYKGAPYGMAVKVRAIAGPFRGQYELAPIVVRQRIEVDRSTAKVSVISDPLPTVWHGVPLRVRRVLVKVDRSGFMLNPSDCSAKQIDADIHSAQGDTVRRQERFKVGGCASLAFKPKLTLALTGKRQVTTGKHPGIKATVTQAGVSEAGIEQAVVTLPKSLALDPNNAQALCEFEAGTKPDLENHCPKGSIVGRARAATPLLNRPLAGNVYFVKNVRRDPNTGNLIRTLPMIVVALRGEIAVNLKGESSTTKAGRLVNTFNSVPDAPISQFNLNIQGGNNGILAVTRTRKAKINLCASRQIAETDMNGHNGRTNDTNVRMKTPCTKKQTKAAKLRAKRAA